VDQSYEHRPSNELDYGYCTIKSFYRTQKYCQLQMDLKSFLLSQYHCEFFYSTIQEYGSHSNFKKCCIRTSSPNKQLVPEIVKIVETQLLYSVDNNLDFSIFEKIHMGNMYYDDSHGITLVRPFCERSHVRYLRFVHYYVSNISMSHFHFARLLHLKGSDNIEINNWNLAKQRYQTFYFSG